MKSKLLLMIAIFIYPLWAHALSAELQKKYPYTVLTDDYGILNEIDLDSELDGVKHPPLFSFINKPFIYWQCFLRSSVTISLEDLGDSPEEDNESDIKYNGENNAELTINIRNKNGIFHKYTMTSDYPTTFTEDRFNRYLKLMQGEKNVCIAGAFLEKQMRIVEGKKQQVNIWVFRKMKTLKGCEAYNKNGCHYALVR